MEHYGLQDGPVIRAARQWVDQAPEDGERLQR
jgi:hypothetical protein